MRTSAPRYATLVAGVLSLAIGYIFAGLPVVAAPILLIGAFWIAAEIKGWQWITSLSLILLIIGAAIGIILGVGPIWAILGTILALDAWELGYFQRFIESVPMVRNENDLTRRHHSRVIIVSVIGALTAWITTQVTVDLGFGAALLLAIISLFGLSRAVVFLRQTE